MPAICFRIVVVACFTGLSISSFANQCRSFEESLYLNTALQNSSANNRYLDSLLQCGNSNPSTLLASGKYFYNRDEYTRAEKVFYIVLENSSATEWEKGEAYYYLGLVYLYTDLYDKSISYSQKAVELSYYPQWAYNNIGIAYSRKKLRYEAIKFYEKSLKISPDYALAYNNIGVEWSRLGYKDVAISHYRIADSLANYEDALFQSNIIRAFRDLNKNDIALSYAEKAIVRFPNDKRIMYDYANALNKNGFYKQALAVGRMMLNASPRSGDNWFDIAHTYDEAGEIDSAALFYKVTIRYDNENASAHHNLGIIYKKFGLFDQAHVEYNRALELDSTQHLFYNSKILAHTWRHEYEKALEWANIYCGRFPNMGYCYLNMGYILMQLKRYEEAVCILKNN